MKNIPMFVEVHQFFNTHREKKEWKKWESLLGLDAGVDSGFSVHVAETSINVGFSSRSENFDIPFIIVAYGKIFGSINKK